MEFQPTFDQAYAYYAYRLPLQQLPKRDALNVHCPFHQDEHPSMSLNLAKGIWNCHSCNRSGGMLDFEREMMHTDVETAWAEIYRIIGMEPPKVNRKLVKVYEYTDVIGKLLYQKLRYEPKDFSQRQPDGKGGWWYNLHGAKKVLYRLPAIITAKVVICVEGEKDADNLQAAIDAAGIKGFAVTTTFDGAGHWKQEYAPYFTGKMVVVIPDNDAKGKAHAQTIAASVNPYAEKVKLVELPEVPEKEDISWWLEAGHTIKELFALLKKTPLWEPEHSEHVLLEEMRDFIDRAPLEIDWLVDGVIPVGTRGLMVADAKSGKTSVSLDLALALASGSSWLGHVVSKRRRVAIISREDAPQETARRLRLLQAGSAARAEYNWGQVWINTVAQSPEFLLNSTEEVDALIKELQMEQFDLAIFDVLRELHTGDENDNTIMAAVLATLKRIQAEARCAILLLHHLSKQQSLNVFRDARGAGAIHGWTEWGVGLTVEDESLPRRDWVRKADFELKYACPADPVYFRFVGDDAALNIELTEPPIKPVLVPRRSQVRAMTSYNGFDNKSRAYKHDDDDDESKAL
jgi:5S rRNA maturation endonuclease (ribonuclease M5)/archaellum biogenesis ATPase FlaH